jgi:small subunit ribosomal protein S20
MANHKSALKRIRQNEKRRLHNRVFRNRARTLVKQARSAMHSVVTARTAAKPDAEKVKTNLTSAIEATKTAIRDLDRAASRGTIHKRNAARRKSRLMSQLAALQKQ